MIDPGELIAWIGQAQAIITDPDRQTDAPELRRAVELLRRVDAALPAELADLRPDLAGMLGGALTSLFELTPDRPLIDEAVRVLSRTTDPLGLTNLGLALRMRYRHYGRLHDLRHAAAATQRAVAGVDGLAPFERAALLSNHGIMLQELFVAEPRRRDRLDEAVAALRGAVDAAPGHPERYRWLGALANTYLIGFDVTGSVDHLDAAIEQLRRIEPGRLPLAVRSAHLSTLGSALGYRFNRTGHRDDLDQAVDLLREAVRRADGSPDPAGHRANLGQALVLRFRLFGGTEDADEAIAACRGAVTATPLGHVDRATQLAALGGALTARFERLGHRADLDAAVDAFRQAVAATPAGRLDRSGWLANLGAALTLRYSVSRDPADGAEAVRWATAAVITTRPHDPARARHLSNLSRTIQAQAASTGHPAAVDEAVAAARAATDPLPTDPALAVTCLHALGDALTQRHELAGDPADRSEAAAVHRRAAAVTGAPNLHRAICAQSAGHLFGPLDWPAAFDCLATATELVGALAGRTVGRPDREHVLTRFTGTATDAAAAALGTGEPARGVTVLEQGRGVLLAQILETGHDLDAVRAQRPDLAERLSRLGRLLELDDRP